jgi:hypothetical protein
MMRLPDIKRCVYLTLPLALSPVNQIVIPFCCRKSTLSLMLTDPGESVSDRGLIGMDLTWANQGEM